MDEVELIKEKISIVDLISEYLPLKKTGVNFKANCPFHQERTPSFVVSPERRIWHCFGCDRGGDVFKFLMEKEGLSFPEALEILAQKAGVVLKKRIRDKDKGERDRLFEVNKKALQFFHYLLTDHPLGKKALDYLHRRGLTDQTIKIFCLGYAPKSWETLTLFLKKRGFKVVDLISAGLAIPSRRGCYDRFRGRITFPLVDNQNRILGFSARVLDSSLPKYINTPTTPIFDKGKFLFGLHLAKGEIRQKKEAILVEGEMDMILSFQSGIKNIVASKGTALTVDQVDLIKKFTPTINLCFDTDLAGDEAARRGIEIAEAANLNIKVIPVSGGKDPGEIVLKDSKIWQEMVEKSTPIYDYYLSSVEKRLDLKSAFGKKEAMLELLPIWQKISDRVTKEHYIQKLATLLQVKEEVVRAELVKVVPAVVVNLSQAKEVDHKKDDSIQLLDRRRLLEEYLIALILHIPPELIYVPNFPETLLTKEQLRQVFVLLVLFLDSISFKGKSFKIAEFVSSLPEEIVSIVDRLYLMQIDEKLSDPKHWQKEIEGVVSELKKMLIKSSLEKLSLEIKNAQQFDRIETLEILNKRFRDLSVKLKNL